MIWLNFVSLLMHSFDAWSQEFNRTSQLVKDLQETAVVDTLTRGKLRQVQQLIHQLERGVLSTTMTQHVRERGEALIALRQSFRLAERRLLNEPASDDEEEQESLMENRLNSLHSSVKNLKEIGSDISTEISTQIGMLNGLDKNADRFLGKETNLKRRLTNAVDQSSSLCFLYLVIICLSIAIIHIAIAY